MKNVLTFSPLLPLCAAALPGSEMWQTYLDQSPLDAQAFAASPFRALRALFPEGLTETLRGSVRNYADVLLFLLLAALLAFLTAGAEGGALLDLVAVGGCGVLLWRDLAALAQSFCAQIESWQTFLLGFLPVYAGVLAAGGETAAASSVSGLLLSALCLLAQALGACVEPLLQCYLALSIACCISSQEGLAPACRLAGQLLCKGLALAGKGFALLLGVQRVFTLELDRSAVRAARLLTGTVPVIGQTLSDAAETALAGLQMLKSSLGLAAIGILGAEFVPLYVDFLVQGALLSACGLLCSFAEIRRCRELFDCLAQAVRCMAAATALFFGITMFGTVLMFMAGGG